MAAFIFLLFLFAFYSAPALAKTSTRNITLGSSLTPTGNSSWLSSSGLFAFGFYQQGNNHAVGIFLAGIPEKTVVWTANRDNPIFPSNVSLLLSRDGRLILQRTQGQDINIVLISESISLASMLDSGNFVLYNSQGRAFWQSFDHPTNTLLPGQRLKHDQELVSSASEADDSSGMFKIIMQSDGNLVQYPVSAVAVNMAYYSSGTYESGDNVTLELEGDGHLYLLNSSRNILKNITGGGLPRDGKIYLLKIDVDGIVRLYSFSINQGNQSILWQSTYDECAPPGRCGLNAYCTKVDNTMECRCLPGFDFVNQGNWSSDCERNFTTENCKSKEVSVAYSIETLGSIVFENNPFSVLQTDTKDDCEKRCLEDCNCEAAFFYDGQCTKQRLPLKFGRRKNDDPNMALIKLGKSLSISGQGSTNNVPTVIKKKVRVDVLIIGILLAVFGVLIFIIAGIYVGKNGGRSYKEIPQTGNIGLLEEVAPRAFNFKELEQATNDFNEALGRGAFGTVYKGVLPNSQKVVAVKKLEKVLTEGEREFQNEIRVIGKTHHRNLVRLLGYSLDGMRRLLVYEYMSNGSLADVLFKMENRLCWDDRIRIARDVARGILYLHEECETQIIHCDLKPQNILLDESRCAKISDFGLAKLLDHYQTRTYTALRGTKGYVAPEWHRNSAVTVKADVYSFGIVLLEIVCLRTSVDYSLSEDEAVLEEWAYDCFEAGELYKLVAADEEVDMRKFERMIKIALWCIQNDPSFRPSIKKVLLMLEGSVDIPMPPAPDSFLNAV